MINTVNVIAIAPAEYLETLRGILDYDGIRCTKLMSSGSGFDPAAVPPDTHCAVMYTRNLDGPDFDFMLAMLRYGMKIAPVILSDDVSREVYDRALYCGASKLLQSDTDPDAVCSAVMDAGTLIMNAQRSKDHTRRGIVLSFYSTRGGAGKAFCAVNAAALFHDAGKSTLIVDAVSPFGDIAYLLRSDPAAVPAGRDLTSDSEALFRSLASHSPSGISTLNADTLLDTDCSGPGNAGTILETYSKYYDAVIADLPSDYSASTAAMLGKSDRIFFVLNSELPALKTAAEFLDGPAAKALSDKISVILNRGTANGLTVKDLERALGKTIDAVIPACPGYYSAFPSDGKPLVSARPMTRTSKAFRTWFCKANGLAPEDFPMSAAYE